VVLFGFSEKKLFRTLPTLLNKPMGFITKRLEKQFKDSPLQSSLPQPFVAEITRCGFTGACTFFIEFNINFKRGRGQIVVSISQVT